MAVSSLDKTIVERLPVVVGTIVLAISTSSLIGRLFGVPALVITFGTDYPMAINGMILFGLAGLWLVADTYFPQQQRFWIRWVALAALAYTLLIGVQSPLHTNLGIDIAGPPTGISRLSEHPGRLATNTILGLLLVEIGIIWLITPRAQRAIGELDIVSLLGAFSAIIGLAGALGYLLDLEAFYSWYDAVQMSLPSALILIGLGLSIICKARTRLVIRDHVIDSDRRVTHISAALLIVVALVCVSTGLSALQADSVETVNEDLEQVAFAHTQLIVASIKRTALLARTVSAAPELGQNVRLLADARARAEAHRYLDRATERLGHIGFTSIDFEDPGGNPIYRWGVRSDTPELAVPLEGDFQGSTLLWDKALKLETVIDIIDDGKTIGRARVQTPLTVAQEMMMGSGRAKSDETKLCARGASVQLDCFPDRLIAKVHHSPEFGAGGLPFPVARAIRGQSGATRFTDFLGHRVLAAYTPIGNSGLGLVQKVDLIDVYAPLERRLSMLLGIPLLLVVAGVLILRLGVRPLIRHIVEAEHEARAAQALHQASEKRLRAITDNIPIRIAYVTPDHRITFANQAFAQAARSSIEEVTGKPARIILGDASYAIALPYVARALAGEAIHYERDIETGDQVRSHDVTYTPDVDESGQVRGLYALSYDISELKSAQRALAQSEHHLRAVADSLPALVTYVDRDERYRFVNEFVKSVFGVDPQWMVGRTMREVAPPELYESLEPHIRTVLGGMPCIFDGTTKINGQTRYFHSEYLPDFSDSGEVAGFYTMALDTTAQTLAQESLRLSEERFRVLLEGVTDYAIIMLDADGKVISWNAGAQRIKGYSESEILGRHMSRFYPQEALDAGLPLRLIERARVEGHVSDEGWRVRKDGSRFWAATVLTALRDERDRLRGFSMVARDRSETHRAEEALRATASQLRAVTDNMPALICYIDRSHFFRFNNERYTKWLRKPLSEITNRPVREVYGEAVYQQLLEPLERALKGEVVKFDAAFPGWDGATRYARGTYIPDRAESGEVLGVHGLIRDVTEARHAELDLMRAAQFDNLTGLPNRGHFTSRLREVLAQSDPDGQRTALMFLDLDRFKSINDEFGHQGGDEVLLEFAQRLKASVRPTDTVGRLAGDEFVILLTHLNSPDEAQFVARKILAAMSVPFAIQGKTLKVSTSIGVAVREGSERDTSAFLRRADEALYQAKESGRNAFKVAT